MFQANFIIVTDALQNMHLHPGLDLIFAHVHQRLKFRLKMLVVGQYRFMPGPD